jgi:hypothetical protein
MGFGTKIRILKTLDVGDTESMNRLLLRIAELVGELDLDYRTRSGIFEFEWDDLILDPLDGEPAY